MTASDSRNLIALPAGFRLGEYRIERYLGSGGFGITYAAIDENLNRRVAIKEYLPKAFAMRGADDRVTVATAEDEVDFRWGLDRFLDEARALGALRSSQHRPCPGGSPAQSPTPCGPSTKIRSRYVSQAIRLLCSAQKNRPRHAATPAPCSVPHTT